MSAFSDMVAGSRDRCRTPSIVNGKQLEWTVFKSKESVHRFVLLATVRERQERVARRLETTSSYETSPSANESAIAWVYLDQRVLDKEINLRLEAEHGVQRQRIDELEKEKEQARRNNFHEQEKMALESDLLKERNVRLEAEQVVQSKWIDNLENEYIKLALRNDLLEKEQRGLESNLLMERNQELEKEKKQEQRNDLLEQEKTGLKSDLLKERNQRLEAESKVIIEERNLLLETEQVVQSKWIDELEKGKEQAESEFAESEDELIIRVVNMADPSSPDITCDDASRSEGLSDHFQLSDGVGMSNAVKAAQVDPKRDLNPQSLL